MDRLDGDCLQMIKPCLSMRPARTQPHETVYFPVHGVFGWDGALIAFAYQWAREAGVGTELDL